MSVLEHHVTWQPSLLAEADQPDFDPTLSGARRRFLGQGAWVDHVPGWVTGGDPLFDELLDTAPWQGEQQRPMYDRIVDVPRLTTGRWDARPQPALRAQACVRRAPHQRHVPRAQRQLKPGWSVLGGAHLGGIPEGAHRGDLAGVVEGHHVDDVDHHR